jgi:hypothetical protein
LSGVSGVAAATLAIHPKVSTALEEGPDPKCVVEADVSAGVRSVRLSEFNWAAGPHIAAPGAERYGSTPTGS